VDSGELMKRSEAIELIFDRLWELNGNTLEFIERKEACKILTDLENAGMLPPKTKLNRVGVEDNAWEPEE
jgi:hypothetical protein